MDNSDVLGDVKSTLNNFAASLKGFFKNNPYLYGFLLIVVFIYGSQYVPSLPKQLTPLLNNPISHFLYFYLVCVLLYPEMIGEAALVALVVTIVINFITDGRSSRPSLPQREETEESTNGNLYSYEAETENEEAERAAVEAEYERQVAAVNGNGNGNGLVNAPAPAENGGYAPVGY